MLFPKLVPPTLSLRSSIPWFIAVLFVGIFVLEFLTPPNYIFGYFYIGPILLTNSRLGRKAAILATMIAVALTLLNLYVPGGESIEPSTIADRIIVSIALTVTATTKRRSLSSRLHSSLRHSLPNCEKTLPPPSHTISKLRFWAQLKP